VLRHEGVPEPHFDLMIEVTSSDPLWTFRTVRWPVQMGDVLEQLPDHRREYLDYEGPISGGRGSVSRVEAGDADHAIVPSWPPQRLLHLGTSTRLMLRQLLEGERGTDRWEVVDIRA
jgi:hypothetical protein